MKYSPVHYQDYLELDRLLNSQKRRSEEYGQPAHDEMLFIIVHQAYELWFKQILFELNPVLEIFKADQVEEKQLGFVVARLERIRDIQKFILGQIDIMETMTPLDFLDFREYLYPASGFQSFQWRMIETKLGLRLNQRVSYTDTPFWESLHPSAQAEMQQVASEPSLFDRLERWLERTPFLAHEGYDFWSDYQKAVLKMLNDDETVVRENPALSETDKERNIKGLEMTKSGFLHLFDNERYSELQKQGSLRFSNQALRAALFIQVYRDEPILNLPYRLLACLVDLDEKMTEWRHRHAMMAGRMLGKKIGTGGSSGHDYLKAATDGNKIFGDLLNLSSFLIPRSQIPPLPKSLERKMNFYFRPE